MSETVANWSTPPARNPFATMLVLSVVVHLSVTSALFLLRGNPGNGSLVTTVDLALTPSGTPATPAAPPRKVVAMVPPPVKAIHEDKPSAKAEPEPAPLSPYEALQQEVKTAQEQAEANPGALANVSFGLGMTNGYFGTLSEGKTLRPDIREYYLALLQKINETWWVGKKGQEIWTGGATFNITIDRNGEVVGLELARSSGNQQWDKRMLDTIKAAGNLPPLPSSYTDPFFRAPLRFVAPLNLMLTSASPH